MASEKEFTESQKNFLQGFAMGSDVARKVQGLPIISNSGIAGVQRGGPPGLALELGPQGAKITDSSSSPEDVQTVAQNQFLNAGKKLSKEEKAKREKDPFSMWAEMREAAAEDKYPKGDDVFLYKFHGLFYVAPNQNSFMCRLRIAGGDLSSWQLRGVADLADRCGGGYVDLTTRANLQIREIPASRGCELLEGLVDLGLVNKGSGADNVRNITCSATSGIDPRELCETLPLAKAMHHHILNTRDLYRLPRKFNISFDGGGEIPTLDETNDLAFQAVTVTEEFASEELPAGVYFRLALGGITGHEDFARSTGVLLRHEDCVPVADAVLRVFLRSGDRTDREKARLKYVLDDWGFEKFLKAVEEEMGRTLPRVESERFVDPLPPDRWAHVGVHPQKQDNKYYVGVIFPVGRSTSNQTRGLARIAEKYGSGRIRLTVWQNLILPDIDEADLEAVKQEIVDLGLDWSASSIRSGLVACTGNKGCKFAAADTKGQAMYLANYLEERIDLDVPINLHFTGCPNSCAQHYIGDIGMRGTKVEEGEEMVEGYEIVVGGGYSFAQAIGRQLYAGVAFSDIPPLIERLLQYYLDQRESGETFAQFANRHELEDLRSIVEPLVHAT
ncbi:NirA family protein [Thalassoglobus sp. JC818]|uniref:NirA family protein n=1 Tax=Thalassoglobus sp. JC818 TaxID=3232136 RepID=UPI00345895C6